MKSKILVVCITLAFAYLVSGLGLGYKESLLSNVWYDDNHQLVYIVKDNVKIYSQTLSLTSEVDLFPPTSSQRLVAGFFPSPDFLKVAISISWYQNQNIYHSLEIRSLPDFTKIKEFPNLEVHEAFWAYNGNSLLVEKSAINGDASLLVINSLDWSTSQPIGDASNLDFIALNPLNNQILMFGKGGTALWNLFDTGTKIKDFPPIVSASFSPDGLYLAVAYDYSNISILDTSTYTLVRGITASNLEISELAWTAKGLFVTSLNWHSYLFNPTNGQIIWDIPSGYVDSFAWSGNGSIFLKMDLNQGTTLHNGDTGAVINRLIPDVVMTYTPDPSYTIPTADYSTYFTPVATSAPTLVPTIAPTSAYTCTVSGIATEAALKTAITNANALSTASILCLQPSTTITVTTLAAPNNSFGDSFLPLIQRDITIAGNGSTLTRSTSAVHGRFFRVAGADAKLTLDGITLTGGIASGNSKGGAVRVDSRMVILKNNTIITGNSAEAGGAIYNYLGTVQIENSTLSNNTVGTDGGALYGIGIFNLTNTIVSENKSSNNGGGMYVFNASGTLSQVTLTDSTFLSNEATNNGGGLSLMSGVTLTLNRGFIKTNWAINFGGGMALTDANATVTTTEFEGNYSTNTQSRGGAIFMTGTDAALTVNAAKFLNNTTKTSGGAIYNASGDINLTGGWFTGNQTQASGSDGGAIFSSNASAELKVQNAKFTSNSALDQGGAVARSNGTGFMSGSCLVTNTAANGAAVYSSNSFTATNNWWNNTTPPVNSQVTTSPVTPGTTCPLG